MMVVYVNTVLCGMLFYTCFCRLVRTDHETFLSIRLAFVVLAGASAFCFGAPLGWLKQLGVEPSAPQAPQLIIEGAMALVQALTAQYWRDGVPYHFQRKNGHADS